MPRTMSDAEALDQITARYATFGQDGIFENTSSTIEAIGDTLERTGRKAWFEEAEWERDDTDDEFAPDECQGHATCNVTTHVHGCYADLGNCDDPSAHPSERDPR